MADEKNPDAVKGGNERARRLSPTQRTDIARRAAYSRWITEGKEPPILAEYGSPDRPLRLGSVEIPCYVLPGERRVLAQRGLQSGIGLSEGGGQRGARKIVDLMAYLAKKGIDIKNLIARVNSPIRFIPPHGGNPADGYEAEILPDICAVIIEAGRQGKLHWRQRHLAVQCAKLQHIFATLGLTSLIDEATGYQDFRPRDALARIIEKYVAKEMRPWVRTFPADFYKEIFRLNEWEYYENCGRPGVVGKYTDNIVYKRLAPGVRDKLREMVPRDSKGRLKNKLFQGLTENYGYLKLQEHLTAVTMLLKYSANWTTFMERVDREFPQWGTPMMLPFTEKRFLGPRA